MTVRIRKNIPIPPPPRRGRPAKIPLKDLCVGCSCDVESGVKSVRSCVRLFNRNHEPDWQFQLLPLDEKNTRIWRTK